MSRSTTTSLCRLENLPGWTTRYLWQARKVWEDEKPDSPGLEKIRNTWCHLVHDRAPAHTDKKIAKVLDDLLMSETFVKPTGYLQVLDVGLARSLRAGYELRQLDFFRDLPKGSAKVGVPELRKLTLKWVVEAFYEDVSEELIAKLGPSNCACKQRCYINA